MRDSDAFGPFVECLRRAEARGLDVGTTLGRLVTGRRLDDAKEVAAVLHARAERWASVARPTRPAAGFVAGLVPRALQVEDATMAQALVERDEALRRRAHELAVRALARSEPWVLAIGSPPADPLRRARWYEAASVVAAYRKRWDVGAAEPVGPAHAVRSDEERYQRERALAAARQARRWSGPEEQPRVARVATAEFAYEVQATAARHDPVL